jgi:hypothetical protein
MKRNILFLVLVSEEGKLSTFAAFKECLSFYVKQDFRITYQQKKLWSSSIVNINSTL